MMRKAKIVRFYKPGRNGWKFHREQVIHELEVFEILTKNWERQYGKGSYELVVF